MLLLLLFLSFLLSSPFFVFFVLVIVSAFSTLLLFFFLVHFPPLGHLWLSSTRRVFRARAWLRRWTVWLEETMSSHHGVGVSPDLQMQSAVQLKYGQTYIENFIEEAGSLPLELQRILLTIKDLDERSTELGAALQSAATRCLELPSACSRFVTREQASEIAALRKRMEEIESVLAT